MSYEVTGKLIEKYDTQRVSDRFQKREFVIEFTEMINGQPSQYPNFIKLTLVQQKVDIIDRFNTGDNIKVSFNLRGSRYEKDGKVSYFTNLDAWRVEMSNEGAQPAGNTQQTTSNNGGNWSANTGNNGGNWTGGNNNNGGSNGNAAFSNSTTTESADDLPF